MEPEQKTKHLCCAIYTRKSTSEGLDQDFTSLDAQREAAENYIKSQQHEGWTIYPERYDDGGFTGANTERPALQKLLNAIKDKRINCVIVYKVDRLSRSLLDFSRLLEFFDKNNITFVSVTQHFNTNTSMGRLTLNILLSFAQFEREIISERTRDKIAAARQRGQWHGGITPLGYVREKEAKKLIIAPDEAAIVREIYKLYIEGNTLLGVAQILNERGLRSRVMKRRSGHLYGGNRYGVTVIQKIITNVTYIGKLSHKNRIYDGIQEPIIDAETFKKAQEQLAENRVTRKAFKNTDCSGLLSRLIKCKACGTPMIHTYTTKKQRIRYRYYVCTNAQKRGYLYCPNKSINAQVAEDEIIKILRKTFSKNPETIKPEYQTKIDALLSQVWVALTIDEKRRILKALIKEIVCDVPNQNLQITFKDPEVTLKFDADVKKSREQTLWHKEIEITKEPKIRSALILAHQIQRFLDSGRIESPAQAAEWINLSQTRIDHLLSLLLLSPSIQQEILLGDNELLSPIPQHKVRSLAAEVDWNNQSQFWEEIKAASR